MYSNTYRAPFRPPSVRRTTIYPLKSCPPATCFPGVRAPMEALRSCVGARSTKGTLQYLQVWRHGSEGWARVGRRRADPAPCRQRFPAAATSDVTVSCRDEQPERRRRTVRAPPPRSVAASDLRVGELLNPPPPRLKAQNMEELLEKVIYRCRFFTLLGVLGSLVGSVLCFLKGCEYVAASFVEYFTTGGKVMSVLIEAIDIYLVGTVMLVFGMGLYELFISNLDIAKISSQRSNFLGLFMLQERPKWLEIQSVNELKTKLGHVIVMVLLVGLFEKVQKVVISTHTDLLCFTASILLSSCGLYLLSKLAAHSKHK